MELYNEDDLKKRKKSKTPIIIGISISILIVLTLIILYLIIYLKSMVMTITVDSANMREIEKIIYIEETPNGNELYIPIRKIAKYLGYEDFSGDYKNKSEDESKCYISNKDEVSMFTLNSNIITKITNNSNYEYIEIDKEVFQKNGELFTTIDGIKKAYNVEFSYDQEKKKIEIYTMDYLVNYAATRLQLQSFSTVFSDRKAIFEDMIVIQENNQYGVISASTGKSILETKYDSIEYLSNSKDFLVKSNGKFGIMSKDATIKVKIVYDDIRTMDTINGLYMVKENNLFGVIDIHGNTVIETEYQQIGININDFSQNGVENQYVLLNELIPIKNNNLWGFFNLNGEKITEFKYTDLGCKSSKASNSYPTIVIPSYNIIVVKENDYYNLIRTNGKEIIPSNVLDSVYMRRNATTGENTFYMTYNGITEDIEKRLSEIA